MINLAYLNKKFCKPITPNSILVITMSPLTLHRAQKNQNIEIFNIFFLTLNYYNMIIYAQTNYFDVGHMTPTRFATELDLENGV